MWYNVHKDVLLGTERERLTGCISQGRPLLAKLMRCPLDPPRGLSLDEPFVALGRARCHIAAIVVDRPQVA